MDRKPENEAIRSILFPRSVAVVGASSSPGKLGHTILRNVIERGFAGSIYPVNPREERIFERTAYPDLASLPEAADLAVVAVPGPLVLPVIEQAAAAGIRGAIVVSAGFSETGAEEGSAAERRLRDVVRSAGMLLIGPNCQGVLSARGRLSAWFGPLPDRPGPGLFVSQSGGLAGTMIELINRRSRGLFDVVVSLGNKCSVDEADLLDALAEDDDIRFAMAYIEGFGEGRGRVFVEAAKRFGRDGKPIIVLKGGRSSSGERATSSHTGSLAGSDRVFEAAMHDAGVRVARSIREWIDIARLCAVQAPATGRRVLILTNLGGPGVVTADLCERHGLVVPPTPAALKQTLRERIPAYCAVGNPIDLAGDPAPERYGAILDAVYASDAFDGVLIVAAPLAGGERIAADIVRAYRAYGKPTAVCWMGDVSDGAILDLLEDGGLPPYDMPDSAVAAMSGLLRPEEPS